MRRLEPDESRENFHCLHPDDTICISFWSDSNIDGLAIICASMFDLGKLGHKDALEHLILPCPKPSLDVGLTTSFRSLQFNYSRLHQLGITTLLDPLSGP
jgi:hypothetical protein